MIDRRVILISQELSLPTINVYTGIQAKLIWSSYKFLLSLLI